MFRKGRKVRYIRVILKAGAWKRVPMKLLKWRRSMPSTKRYDLVPNDEYDTRIPLHPDEAFEYGITFHAKYIGTMDVPRPTSRVEIVAAMRRVRYEFKAKGAKKRKVTVDVSVDGVRVTTRTNCSNQKKRSRFFSRNKKSTTECIEIMHHPIYRIFYVSHDSSDLKIFSYIARDGATNVFKCNVFKSTKKSQAMKIVRTVGQAFEVCHKMQANPHENPVPSTSSAPDELAAAELASEPPPSKEPETECGVSEPGSAASRAAEEPRGVHGAAQRPKHLDLLPPPPQKEVKRSTQIAKPVPSINLPELPECVTKVDTTNLSEGDAVTPLSAQHHVQLLRERLEQQAQQTRAAVAQLLLLRDQLAAEQAARCEAQARTHQLLIHNKELLEHIAALVAHLQEKEKGNSRPISAQQLTLLPQIRAAAGASDAVMETVSPCNGNCRPFTSEALIEFIAQSNKMNQNVENNNINLSNCRLDATATDKLDGAGLSPSFGNMTNDQIQNYLISKFRDMPFTNGTDVQPRTNKHFFQNCKAFPHIPPLSHHCSNSDLASLLRQQCSADKSSSSDELGAVAQAMSVGHSQNSLYSTSQPTTSKDSSPDSSSSDEAVPFIMPLSHNGTLTATGEDGRVRLIVPVSPSSSAAGLTEPAPTVRPTPVGATLQVPAPAAPITRSTSEKVPNRSEMMTALRSQWTRHTTK
ncbi:carboxyl-terminal PDZ ligand of neuronal nitric oxide synthase protein [Maniola jurtina]|uniref:carboxyl-terminal PDZ ligand of neuronal nitric oxide synthase protein n=1 Tax=Maniola jurtina TaxID=191418 RepID=UPI001E68D3FE|nr:carboxyl-terminal PDZ ligand of neuronal nitric oxide synthase protein [Maniola jurtina]